MLATKIFPQTFRNFQKLITRNQLIEENLLSKTRNPLTQFHISNLFAMTNLISLQLSQLQKDHVVNLLESFNMVDRKYSSGICHKVNTEIKYDQNGYFFSLRYLFEFHKNLPLLQTIQQVQNMHDLQVRQKTKNYQHVQTQNLQVRIKIKNCEQEKFDHPSTRETLYFHQLKDLDKYIKYDFLPKTPLFIQDMNRKKLQMKVLDQKNPFGYPLKASPLIFDVQLGNKAYFKVKSTYEQTNIIEIGSLRKVQNGQKQLEVKKSFSMKGMKVPRNIQEMLFNDILTSLLMIGEQQILKFHELAYIGGRAQKLNCLMNVHETMALESEELFDQLINS